MSQPPSPAVQPVGTPTDWGSQNAAEQPSQVIELSSSTVRKLAVAAVGAVVAVAVIFWFFTAVNSFLFMVLIAWLVSIAMEPAVGWFAARGWKRGAGAGLVLFVGVVAAIGVIAAFGGVFVSQAQDLATEFPTVVKHNVERINQTFHTNLDSAAIEKQLQLSPEQIQGLFGKYGGGLLGVAGSVVTLFFEGVTILMFAFYLSADSLRLRRTIGSWMPARQQRMAMQVWQIAVEKTGGYVVSKVVLALASAIAHSIAFRIIDVPFWLPLGLLAGIVGQFIPTVGTYLGIIIPVLFTVLQSPVKCLWIVIFATIYQQIENYVLTPRISRRTMDVHPAVALGSVFIGAALWGPIGALIGIPVIAALITIFDTFRKRHELLPELAGGGAPAVDPATGPGDPAPEAAQLAKGSAGGE